MRGLFFPCIFAYLIHYKLVGENAVGQRVRFWILRFALDDRFRPCGDGFPGEGILLPPFRLRPQRRAHRGADEIIVASSGKPLEVVAIEAEHHSTGFG